MKVQSLQKEISNNIISKINKTTIKQISALPMSHKHIIGEKALVEKRIMI
jgi:hypothetical protein